LIALTNLADKPGSKKSPKHIGPGSGYVAYCEGGMFHGQRGRAVAMDKNGKTIRQFKGNSGDVLHQRNFIEAVRKNDASNLNADIEVGHASTGWCNLANIAFQSGKEFSFDDAKAIELPQWTELIKFMDKHVAAHDVNLEGGKIMLSPMLTMNPETEMFVGDHADAANPLLKRSYRKGYEVPEIAAVATS
jgi:hypothetical protein